MHVFIAADAVDIQEERPIRNHGGRLYIGGAGFGSVVYHIHGLSLGVEMGQDIPFGRFRDGDNARSATDGLLVQHPVMRPSERRFLHVHEVHIVDGDEYWNAAGTGPIFGLLAGTVPQGGIAWHRQVKLVGGAPGQIVYSGTKVPFESLWDIEG